MPVAPEEDSQAPRRDPCISRLPEGLFVAANWCGKGHRDEARHQGGGLALDF